MHRSTFSRSNKGIKNRLGTPPIKSRLGLKRSVASVALGEILDARQKINFNRVKSGRIGDARVRIEEGRRRLMQQGGYKRGSVQVGGFVGQRSFFGGLRSSNQFKLTRTTHNQQHQQIRIAPPPSIDDDLMLTRTIRNPNAYYHGGVARDYLQERSHDHYHRHEPIPMEMEQEPRYNFARILVSNLQPSVTADDIVELFSDIGPLTSARMTSSGQAEVNYTKKSDAIKAIEAYHNRLLDGSAMRVFMDAPTTTTSSSTSLKSAAGASMKLPAAKSTSSGVKIQPDISAIHKVLFNHGNSATRGLFKN